MPFIMIITVPFYQRIWLSYVGQSAIFLIKCWSKGNFSRLLPCNSKEPITKKDSKDMGIQFNISEDIELKSEPAAGYDNTSYGVSSP